MDICAALDALRNELRQTARILRRSPGFGATVILVTAHDTADMIEAAQRSGAVAYFRKPIDDQALLDAIAWSLDHRAA